MARAFGADWSVWQDDNSTAQRVDFNKAALNGIQFSFIKASQCYADEDFLYNWKSAKAAGILRGAYHFLDWRMNEIDQAKLFVAMLGNDPGELPGVVDFEMRYAAPARTVAIAKLRNFIGYYEQATGRTPMIYTGFFYWQDFGLPDPVWAKYPLWLANYNSEALMSKQIPKPWTNWTFWQYTDKGDGKRYGAESAGLDMDLYNGTLEEMKDWAGIPTLQEDLYVVCPTCGGNKLCPTCKGRGEVPAP